MANVKISDLSALSTQAAADLLAIVDDSASATKKITLTNFFDGVPVAITTTSDISGGTVNATSDTAAGDDAAMGYTAAEGLILTGQGSTSDITVKNDADASVITIATGTTNVDIVGDVTASTVNADGDTAASDNAAMGYTAAEGLILTGQGSTSDVTVKNDADAAVITIATGTTNVDVVGDLTAATLNADGDTAASDNAAIGYTAAEGIIVTGQGSTNDVTIKNDADADVIEIPTGTTRVELPGTLVVGSNLDGDGQLHVHSATAGSVTAHADADELVIENNASAGISILTPNDALGSIYFGDPDDNDVMSVRGDHANNRLAFYGNGGNPSWYINNGHNFFPHVTESYLIGNSSYEVGTIYVQNSIVVSDKRRKTDHGALDEAAAIIGALNPRWFTFKDTVVDDITTTVKRPKMETVSTTSTEIVEVDNKLVQKEVTKDVQRPVYESKDVHDEDGNVIGTKDEQVFEEIEEVETGRTITHSERRAGLMAQDVKTAIDNLGINDTWTLYRYDEESDTHSLQYQELISVLVGAVKSLQSRVDALEA
jgi:hypothetical protein